VSAPLRILLTNDDGIDAPGLEVLESIARTVSDDVWIVAPLDEQSGMSRALTLNAPLRIMERGPKRIAVTGTPTDCVHMAMDGLIEGAKPDLVLSGVNSGQNIAEDVTFSGTVAGAMQGTQLGVRSVAFSQAYGFQGRAAIQWETARTHGPAVLKTLLDAKWSENTLININFPDRAPDQVAGVEVTVQGMRDQSNLHAERRTDLRGRDYFWLGFTGRLSNPPVGTDLRAVYDGRISITPLQLDLTNHDSRRRLDGAFDALSL
jgi:5'-nucleotidase